MLAVQLTQPCYRPTKKKRFVKSKKEKKTKRDLLDGGEVMVVVFGCEGSDIDIIITLKIVVWIHLRPR